VWFRVGLWIVWHFLLLGGLLIDEFRVDIVVLERLVGVSF